MENGLRTHREGLCTGTPQSISRYDNFFKSIMVVTDISVYRCTPNCLLRLQDPSGQKYITIEGDQQQGILVHVWAKLSKPLFHI